MVVLGCAIYFLGGAAHLRDVYKRTGRAAGEDHVGDGVDDDTRCTINEAVFLAILADIDVATISLLMPVSNAAQQSLAKRELTQQQLPPRRVPTSDMGQSPPSPRKHPLRRQPQQYPLLA